MITITHMYSDPAMVVGSPLLLVTSYSVGLLC